jgi:Flagellar hook-length control protein FliK
MTVPAAAPASAPIAPTAPRAPPQPTSDRRAFATVLDSLPGAPAKASASTPEEQPHPSNESLQEESSRGQTAHHSGLNDSALFASLPFALRVGSMRDERPQATDDSHSPTRSAMKGLKSENSGASLAPSAKAPTVGRLIGERAFHLGASTFAGVIASRTSAIDAPFAPGAASAANLAPQADRSGESLLAGGFPRAEAMAAKPFADAVPPPAPTALHAGARSANRVSPTRAAAHEAARGGRNPEISASPPLARAPSSTSPPAPAESSANSKATDGRPPDPIAFAGPSTAQTGPFGAPSLASFVTSAAFGPDASTAGATADIPPRASGPAAGPAPSAPPVREIDVDLSPGGLEDVSMTMRLAGDKLSVVIRAASSHTLNSIEGARDAIADRMAAIGQPLDSLIVKQAGVNTDGNANGNESSADGGSSGSEQRSPQGAGEWSGSNDAGLSRRGAGRDRSF